jgi:preprotein translocase subunit SecD
MEKQRIIIVGILILVASAIFTIFKLPPQLGLDLRGGAQLTIQVIPTKEIQKIEKKDLEAVKVVVEKRINELGTKEPLIQTVGDDKILVQLPGVTDPQEAEEILGGTAKLEFKEQKKGSEGQFTAEFQVQRQAEAALAVLNKQAGNDPKLAEEKEKFRKSLQTSNQAIGQYFQSVGLTGKNLKDASATPTQSGNGWEVAIRFDDAGGQKFAELTKNLAGTGRSIGIFLDDGLISAPTVGVQFAQTGITGNSAVITGNFSIEEANRLAVQIRGGSLPFPVKIVENRTVGATLGKDSINRSISAGLAGLLLVFIFMAVYYRLLGVIADIALAIYTILNLAIFGLLGVTLTLPGIAGFILSIGMAVDANVLIFERTREELKAGKTLYRSIESGFFRAFSSILDSNVTTLIACGALFYWGSGLVKGFALTLAIGVLVSMFTALTCSRTMLSIAVLGFPKLRQRPELFCPNLPTTK